MKPAVIASPPTGPNLWDTRPKGQSPEGTGTSRRPTLGRSAKRKPPRSGQDVTQRMRDGLRTSKGLKVDCGSGSPSRALLPTVPANGVQQGQPIPYLATMREHRCGNGRIHLCLLPSAEPLKMSKCSTKQCTGCLARTMPTNPQPTCEFYLVRFTSWLFDFDNVLGRNLLLVLVIFDDVARSTWK